MKATEKIELTNGKGGKIVILSAPSKDKARSVVFEIIERRVYGELSSSRLCSILTHLLKKGWVTI